MRLGTIDNRAQRIIDHNGNNGHGLDTAVSSFLFLPNVDFHTGQQQVPLSVSHPHNLSLSSAAGSTFFSWSGVTL